MTRRVVTCDPGDTIDQLDWSVGQVMQTLDRLHLSDNTLVIFSSDNGPVVDDGYADGSVRDLNGHTPAGVLRGGKYSIYEGGTRMPFIVRFPGRVQPGVSDAMISQVDLLASFALVKQNVPPRAAPDSTNVLPALLGGAHTARNEIIEHDGFQQVAIRQGNWKLIPAGNFPRRGGRAQPQLYDLANDPGEQHNLAAEQPDKATELDRALDLARKS